MGLVALSVGVIYFTDFYSSKDARGEAERQQAFFEEWEQKYLDDTYGGQTPEETLELFISALEAGDLELAAKYFVIDEQEKWMQNLEKLEEENQIAAMLKDLKSAERGNDITEDSARFIITNQNNEVITILNIAKGPNGIWKIVDL